MRKLLSPGSIFLVPVLLLVVLFVMTAGGTPALALDSGYEITGYHVDIVIDEYNTYHVTENLTVDYHEARHGFYRIIPYRQEMQWEIDGSKKRILYNTPVRSVDVTGAPFDTYKDSGSFMIQIGDADSLVTGEKDYTITFDQLLGNDKIESQDMVYYNITGTDWDCNINNVTFSVTLPETFDSSKVWFYSGKSGSTASDQVDYNIDGNTISGSLQGGLGEGEGLTIQVDLPQGYFDVGSTFAGQSRMIALAVFFLIVSLLLFWRFGRDGALVTPVEFYAPEGITPAEAGYIIDTMVDDKDVVSLILYWAAGGHLSIERLDKEDFIFKKLKDLPKDANKYETTMFGELFRGREQVTSSELKNNFYDTVSLTKDLVARRYTSKQNRLFRASSKALGWLVRLFAIVLTWITLFAASQQFIYQPVISALISFIITIVVTIPFLILAGQERRWQVSRRVGRSLRLILGIIFASLVMLVYVAYMVYGDMLLVALFSGPSVLLLHIIAIFMRKRTKRGSELLGRIMGFKNFLERAEKDRIEKLVEENPSYFYDVLPYAYVLGVTDKWAKNFEGLADSPPDWYQDRYDRGGVFSPLVFQATLFHSMHHIGGAMVSRPMPQGGGKGGFGGGSFGGGGFGGGGGFSGGGFGGGGGRSW